MYEDSQQVTLQSNPLIFRDSRPGMHGYLAFENSANEDNVEFVNGPELGKLLVETDVPVLVLNACRSAHTDAQNTPTHVDDDTGRADDPHSQIRAFGSLAQEVIDAGVAGVVAMRYNVYVMTAAQFVTDLYTALVQGQTLGEAVSLGRKQLDAQPQRAIAFRPIALQDWLVPIVYEAAPIALFSKPAESVELKITLHPNDALPAFGWIDPQMPETPSAGFFGRDETLLAIDRAFDHHSIVLIYAFAGSGKTSTVAEFGRWYSLTGGVRGPVLFTSFERYLPLPRVLDKLSQVFQQELEQSGIHWLTLEDAQRKQVAIQVLSQIPVLWIWDNVESIVGFSGSEPPKYSVSERQELSSFLRDLKQTKARILLTSRRSERGWIADLPLEIQVPPMPMVERAQLANSIAQNYGNTIVNFSAWLPLLEYSQGNPLTLRIIVIQALRNDYTTQDLIKKFVNSLRCGEADIDDEQSQGRSNSLRSSLNYGFQHSFSESEKQRLAPLAFFQGSVSTLVFSTLGSPENNWKIPDLNQTEEVLCETSILLFKASDIGLLQTIAEGFYWIHPALPWFFREIIREYFPNQEENTRLMYSFVRAVGDWSVHYHNEYFNGNRPVIAVLSIEEDNLLHALKISKDNLWLNEIHQISRGLFTLYHHLGDKRLELNLFKELYPFFSLPQSFEPIPGLEEAWNCISHHHLEIMLRSHKLNEAKEIALIKLSWNQKNTADILNIPDNLLNNSQKTDIRNLAVSMEGLAQVLMYSDISKCFEYFEKAINLYKKIKNQTAEAVVTFALAQAYERLNDFQSFTKAQEYLVNTLELFDESDFIGRARSAILFAQICLRRVEKVIDRGKKDDLNEDEIYREVKLAIVFYTRAIEELPLNANSDIGEALIGLGKAYDYLGRFDFSLNYYRRALQIFENNGDYLRIVEAQGRTAISLARLDRYDDALAYANAALNSAKSHRLDQDLKNAENLIQEIERKIQEEG